MWILASVVYINGFFSAGHYEVRIIDRFHTRVECEAAARTINEAYCKREVK